jgi:hypothetical protein
LSFTTTGRPLIDLRKSAGVLAEPTAPPPTPPLISPLFCKPFRLFFRVLKNFQQESKNATKCFAEEAKEDDDNGRNKTRHKIKEHYGP